jgi:hypothetical protein
MYRNRVLLVLAAFAAFGLTPPSLVAQEQDPAALTYDVIEIPPFGAFDQTLGTAISDASIAAFVAIGDIQGLPTANAAMCKYSLAKGCADTDLGFIGDGGSGIFATVGAISRDGDFVVGTRQTERPLGPNQAFWQSTQGKLTRVDLPGLAVGELTNALGITVDARGITGFGLDKDNVMFALVWESATLKISAELSPLQKGAPAMAYSGTSRSFVVGISAKNGERGVKWISASGQPVELPSDTESIAVAANLFFDILGTNRANGTTKCALWPLKGNRVDFGTVKFPEPKALNDSRIAVGKGMTAKGQRAMLWDLSNLKNIQEVDLNDQINPKLGWVLMAANGINSRGEIVGTGMLNKKVREFILVPKKK